MSNERKIMSPRWASGVINQRGIDSPGSALIEQALNRMAPDDLSRFQLTLQKMCKGDETEEEFAYLRRWVDAIKLETPPNVGAQGEQPTALARRSEQKDPSHAVHLMQGTGQLLPKNTRRIRTPKTHVYGKHAALCFEVVAVHVDNVPEAELRYMTVQIDGAKALSGGRFDWENKVSLRLSDHELVLACAVLQGHLKGVEFKYHGSDRNKSFSMAFQPERGTIYAELKRPNWQASVPISFSDFPQVCAVHMKALAANMVGLGDIAVDKILQRTSLLYQTNGSN